MKKYRFLFIFKLVGISALMGLGLLSMPVEADNTFVLTCPELSTAQKLGDCPSDADLMSLFRETCSPMLERNGDCTPYDKFAKSKNKALWAAMSAKEEFLSYIQCSQPPETIKASKIISVETKCSLKSGRCEARCGYENGINFSLRVKGSCETATRAKIDCQNDPKLCVTTCELYE